MEAAFLDIWHLLWDRGEYYMEEKQFRDKVYWLTFLFSLLVVWVPVSYTHLTLPTNSLV